MLEDLSTSLLFQHNLSHSFRNCAIIVLKASPIPFTLCLHQSITYHWHMVTIPSHSNSLQKNSSRALVFLQLSVPSSQLSVLFPSQCLQGTSIIQMILCHLLQHLTNSKLIEIISLNKNFLGWVAAMTAAITEIKQRMLRPQSSIRCAQRYSIQT